MKIECGYNSNNKCAQYRAIEEENERCTDTQLILTPRRTIRGKSYNDETRRIRLSDAGWKRLDLQHNQCIYRFSYRNGDHTDEGEFYTGAKTTYKKKEMRLFGKKKVELEFALTLNPDDIIIKYGSMELPVCVKDNKCSFTIDDSVHAKMVFSKDLKLMTDINDFNI